MSNKRLPARAKGESIKTVKPYGHTTSRGGQYSFAALCPFCWAEGRRTTVLATREEPERVCPTCGHRLAIELPPP